LQRSIDHLATTSTSSNWFSLFPPLPGGAARSSGSSSTAASSIPRCHHKGKLMKIMKRKNDSLCFPFCPQPKLAGELEVEGKKNSSLCSLHFFCFGFFWVFFLQTSATSFSDTNTSFKQSNMASFDQDTMDPAQQLELAAAAAATGSRTLWQGDLPPFADEASSRPSTRPRASSLSSSSATGTRAFPRGTRSSSSGPTRPRPTCCGGTARSRSPDRRTACSGSTGRATASAGACRKVSNEEE
jgi:hypothetical protein